VVKIVAIKKTIYASFGHIFTAYAQKRLVRSFQSKIWPNHLLQRHRFPVTGE